jgi:hypothetical protein
MSTPITEAHREAAVAIFAIAMKSAHHGAAFREPCAQLIADSEARAKESLLVAYDVVCEVRNRLTAERDQLRAEVERLTAQRENLLKPMRDQAIARAERAEAELAAERARLDWLVKSSDNPLAINLFPSYGWTEVKKNLRASIDAAMKEGAK